MQLKHFVNLATSMIFQPTLESYTRTGFGGYDGKMFFLPLIHCVDGFHLSIQCHNGNYCESENGFRSFGFEWKKLEWGFPSQYDALLVDDAEDSSNITQTVGCSSIELLQHLLDSHGGIDLDKTLSKDNWNRIYKQK